MFRFVGIIISELFKFCMTLNRPLQDLFSSLPDTQYAAYSTNSGGWNLNYCEINL